MSLLFHVASEALATEGPEFEVLGLDSIVYLCQGRFGRFQTFFSKCS